MERRPLPEDLAELGRVHGGDPGGVQVADPLPEVRRTREGLLEGDLLIQRETDQEGQGIRGQETIRLRVTRVGQLVSRYRHVGDGSAAASSAPFAAHYQWLPGRGRRRAGGTAWAGQAVE